MAKVRKLIPKLKKNKKLWPGKVEKINFEKLSNKKGSSAEHAFHWKYEDLINLLQTSKFEVLKEYWEKPPATMCLYIEAKKLVW